VLLLVSLDANLALTLLLPLHHTRRLRAEERNIQRCSAGADSATEKETKR